MALYLLESVEHYTNEDEQRCSTEELRELLVDTAKVSKCRHNGNDAKED